MTPLVLSIAILVQLAPQNHVEGILEVPELAGEYSCTRYVPESLDVYATPSRDTSPVGVIEVTRPWYPDEDAECEQIELGFRMPDALAPRPVETREHGYEELGLVVTEVNADWFRVALPESTGWVQPQPPVRFHSYEDLIGASLTYLPRNWDGRLWASPASPMTMDLDERWHEHIGEEITVEVLESRSVGADLWFRIRLDPQYGCGSLSGSPPITDGWVPAYAAAGQNLLWFYSRGC